MNKFKGKKILFIRPLYYDYHSKIEKEFIGSGASVDSIDIITFDLWSIFLRNLNQSLFKFYMTSYYKKVLKNIKDEYYDYVFLIHGYQVSEEFMDELKITNPKAIYIMYQWDSIRDNNYLHLVRFFDKVYSFDREDCLSYPEFNYLPLFYTHEYQELFYNPDSERTEILFIGAYRPDRYDILKKLRAECEKYGLGYKFYLYLPKRSVSTMRRKGYEVDPRFIEFKPLSQAEILPIMAKTKVVIDINNPEQTGLTMRTFETLGAGRKLITTNQNIMKEPFFDTAYINILDRNKIFIPIEFIESQNTIKIKDLEKYRIDNWLKNIFYD